MRPNTLVVLALAALLASEAPLQAQATRSDAIDQALGSLRLREIGPALMGGRIADTGAQTDRDGAVRVGSGTGVGRITDHHGA